jgi:hypothetical protein
MGLSAIPHSVQNRNSGGFEAPQRVQVLLSDFTTWVSTSGITWLGARGALGCSSFRGVG